MPNTAIVATATKQQHSNTLNIDTQAAFVQQMIAKKHAQMMAMTRSNLGM
ncbi:MAG: hypothetical protein IJU89_01105 [Alphaproteobacteria bacterium]|nr:hypothetical protein [Alphaproteobacteria bacterium]